MEKKKEKWNSALKHEKEYLYDEAMKLKKEKNTKNTENRKLSVRVRYLEKEMKKRESIIQELMQKPFKYPANIAPSMQSKQAVGAYKDLWKNNLVSNLKKMIEDQKNELQSKDELIKTLKMDMKGTYLREIKAERNAFEEEAIRLRTTIDSFVSEIGGVDQILNVRGYLDQQQEAIKELESQKEDQQQIYDAKYDECLKLEKKLIQTEMEREDAYKEIAKKESELEKKEEEIKVHNHNYAHLEKKKKETEDNYEDKINDLNKVISYNEEEIDSYKAACEERDQEINKNLKQIKSNENEIRKLKTELENRDGIIAEREYDIEDLKNKISNLEQTLKDTHNDYQGQLKDQEERYTNALESKQRY